LTLQGDLVILDRKVFLKPTGGNDYGKITGCKKRRKEKTSKIGERKKAGQRGKEKKVDSLPLFLRY
jgi:hypothetical protein